MTWLPVATCHRNLDDDERVTFSLANDVVRYRDLQDCCQDDHHQEHLVHQSQHQGGHHRVHLVHQSHRLGDHRDRLNGLVRYLGDQHLGHLDDLHQDYPVRACLGQMDALVHPYLPDRDQAHSPEYDRCEHQHLDQLADHPPVGDLRQVLRQDDLEEEELDDRSPEVAEWDDQLDLDVVVAEDEVLSALGLLSPQARNRLEEIAESHRFASEVVQRTMTQQQVLSLQQVVQK